jgi:hypothetical protein
MAYLRKNVGTVTGIVTQAELDASDNRFVTNLAMLAIRQAADHNDVKYDLQDRIIDNYYNASGIDGTPSTNHTLTSGVYSSVTSATISHNADATSTHLTYTYWKWTTTTSTGTFTTDSAADYEYIVVGGGGGGGSASGGGGGGAGGFRTATGFPVSGTITGITVGAGGGGATGSTDHGDIGASSVFSTITSTGGGGGGSENTANDHGLPGASGGGGARRTAGTGGASNTPYGNDGGGAYDSSGYWGGGGGGAGAVGAAGTSTQGGVGGVGENEVMGMSSADSDTFLTAISAGEDEADGLRYFSGGGGGGSGSTGSGGAGGYGGGTAGGRQSSVAVVDVANNTGGGGGGAYDHVATTTRSANGGSGIVIIRTLTAGLVTAGDIILQSTDTEAETTPTKADLVVLVEDAGSGVGVVQTHIKGWISRDSGANFTQGTLVDEGDWDTDKRILAFHDLDISAQPDDKTMCYKITTHSQSAVYNTKIHATSMGWR